MEIRIIIPWNFGDRIDVHVYSAWNSLRSELKLFAPTRVDGAVCHGLYTIWAFKDFKKVGQRSRS